MGDPVKDFRYYADKAEFAMQDSYGQFTQDVKDRHVRRAEIYARLAAAAPKPDLPIVPCNISLHGYREGRFDGNTRPCIFRQGHDGLHMTPDGVEFHGLKADFPMRDSD